MGIRSSPPHSSTKSRCHRRKLCNKSEEGTKSEAEKADLHQPVNASKISGDASSNTDGNAWKVRTLSSNSTSIEKPMPAPVNFQSNQNQDSTTSKNMPSNAAASKYWSNKVQKEWDKLLKVPEFKTQSRISALMNTTTSRECLRDHDNSTGGRLFVHKFSNPRTGTWLQGFSYKLKMSSQDKQMHPYAQPELRICSSCAIMLQQQPERLREKEKSQQRQETVMSKQ
eukprot:1142141-Rhodomonas_salina.3